MFHGMVYGRLAYARQVLLRAAGGLAALIVTSALYAGVVNDTGVDQCGDLSTMDTSNCASYASEQSAFPRQDGNMGRDAQARDNPPLPKVGAGSKGFDFTKIANDKSELGATAALGVGASDWACTRDNVTGLTWEVKTLSGLRSRDNNYSWYEKSGVGVSNGGSCSGGSGCDTLKFVSDVNSGNGMCGYTDWRLPTVQELEGLIDFGLLVYTIDRDYFPNVQSGNYWTSTTDASNNPAQFAWSVQFFGSLVAKAQFDTPYQIRLVRGTTVASSFVDNNDGTVSDVNLGLMWKKSYEKNTLTWSDALTQAVKDTTGGHSDWRLPNIKELRSLVDHGRVAPAINTSFFPSVGATSTFWSSSPAQSFNHYNNLSWAVQFDGGGSTNQPGRSAKYYVRLVRDVAILPRPLAPTALSATPNDGSTTITFTQSQVPNGGAPVKGYNASCTGGGSTSATAIADASATSITVSGLTNGTQYICSVWATSSVGPGPAATVAVTPTLVTYALTVTTSGTGTVTVTSNPPTTGSVCGVGCTTYPRGTQITLLALPTGSWFGWSGACAGSGPTCTFAMDADKGVGAYFDITPLVAINPAQLIFAGQAIGSTSTPQYVTLSNKGVVDLTISATVASADYWVDSSGCNSVLAPGGFCMLGISFSPLATGSRTGAVTISSDAPSSPDKIALSGIGAAAGTMSLNPNSLVFPVLAAGQKNIQTVSLTNGMAGVLAISSISSSGSAFAVTHNCGIGLQPGGVCALTITFTSDGSSTATGKVTIASNAANSPAFVGLSVGGKANQDIVYVSVPDVFVGFDGVVSAIASSGLTVTFGTSTPTVCAVTTDKGITKVFGKVAGHCTVLADQNGDGPDGTYSPAQQVPQDIIVAPATKPFCTLAAQPASINAGGTSTLTATCSPAATSYVWTGGTCDGTSAVSCTVTPAATTIYTVAGVNIVGTGTASAPTTVTVTKAATPVCTLTATPTTIATGGTSTLTAACSPAATSYHWTGGTCAGTNAVSCTVTPSATTSRTTNLYTVAGVNDTGPGIAVTAHVVVDPNLVGTLIGRYRLYSDVTHEHLYTTDKNEYDVLAAGTIWVGEGRIYEIFNGQGSLTAVPAVAYYRLYNPSSLQHHWTTDANEYNTLATQGWKQEGIVGYILPYLAMGYVTPLYRLYLNAFGGLHLWTIDANEKTVLINTQGWVDEGVAGYVFPLQVP